MKGERWKCPPETDGCQWRLAAWARADRWIENDPLTAGENLLLLPGFWPAYLLWLCQTEENEPEPGWFG
ncbi:hypothetical protein ACFWP3_02915 [Streptomyces sp. NPDC058525]|uniref:hypothetical protein n=1 Tax=Streptomyces sp. NPDC058525 TaxID=3346538 RepID=UPI0036522533